MYLPFQRPFTPLEPRTPSDEPEIPTTPIPIIEGPRYIRSIITGIIVCLVVIILIILAFCVYCVKQNRKKQAQSGCNGGYTVEETFNIEETAARRSRNNSIYGQFGNFFRNIPIRLSSRVSRSESITDSRPDSLIDVNTRQTQSRPKSN